MYNKIANREFMNKYIDRRKLKEEQETCCFYFIYDIIYNKFIVQI